MPKLGLVGEHIDLIAIAKPAGIKQDNLTPLPHTSYNIEHGPLAQLAEQLTLNQPVGGSSPPRLTTKLGD